MTKLISKSEKEIDDLIAFLGTINKLNDKAKIANLVQSEFSLVLDRSVYYNDNFALRFSASESENFGNTVLSLSALQKYDDRPVIIVLVMPNDIKLLLANTTLLKKISHSSHQLTMSNIKGSFNGSDISRELSGITNEAKNLVKLFRIHQSIGFDGNLERLVENTTNISPSGKAYIPSKSDYENILGAPNRALKFMKSKEYQILKKELDDKVEQFRDHILIASLIDNVNVRGRVIEYLITGEDEELVKAIILGLQGKSSGLPTFKTQNTLGDFEKTFEKYLTATDVKTKMMVLHSNPKAYNIDKILQFLSQEKSVFMFFFVGVDTTANGRITNTVLTSMFQKDLMDSTILLKHWAGRNSRGVTQFEGSVLHRLILDPKDNIVESEAESYLMKLLDL
jgi:hypothetical protein